MSKIVFTVSVLILAASICYNFFDFLIEEQLALKGIAQLNGYTLQKREFSHNSYRFFLKLNSYLPIYSSIVNNRAKEVELEMRVVCTSALRIIIHNSENIKPTNPSLLNIDECESVYNSTIGNLNQSGTFEGQEHVHHQHDHDNHKPKEENIETDPHGHVKDTEKKKVDPKSFEERFNATHNFYILY